MHVSIHADTCMVCMFTFVYAVFICTVGVPSPVGGAGESHNLCSGSAQDCRHFQFPEEIRSNGGKSHIALAFLALTVYIYNTVMSYLKGAEVSAEARAERKKWVKTLQRLECVDTGSFAAMAEALKDVSVPQFYTRKLGFSFPTCHVLHNKAYFWFSFVFVVHIICPAPREACWMGCEREGRDFLLLAKGLRAAALSIGGASAAAEQQSGGCAGLVAPRHLAAQPGPMRGAVAEGLRSQQEKYCRYCREKREVK